MLKYRQRDTGLIKSAAEIKVLHKNTSFSKVVDTFADLGWDKIVPVNMPPESSILKKVVEGTPALINNEWTQVWVEEDKFNTDEDGTKAEKEAAYQSEIDSVACASVRQDRNDRLGRTDWMALSDVIMPTEWATYRQELRNVPEQDGFPYDVNWPEKP